MLLFHCLMALWVIDLKQTPHPTSPRFHSVAIQSLVGSPEEPGIPSGTSCGSLLVYTVTFPLWESQLLFFIILSLAKKEIFHSFVGTAINVTVPSRKEDKGQFSTHFHYILQKLDWPFLSFSRLSQHLQTGLHPFRSLLLPSSPASCFFFLQEIGKFSFKVHSHLCVRPQNPLIRILVSERSLERVAAYYLSNSSDKTRQPGWGNSLKATDRTALAGVEI